MPNANPSAAHCAYCARIVPAGTGRMIGPNQVVHNNGDCPRGVLRRGERRAPDERLRRLAVEWLRP